MKMLSEGRILRFGQKFSQHSHLLLIRIPPMRNSPPDVDGTFYDGTENGHFLIDNFIIDDLRFENLFILYI